MANLATLTALAAFETAGGALRYPELATTVAYWRTGGACLVDDALRLLTA